MPGVVPLIFAEAKSNGPTHFSRTDILLMGHAHHECFRLCWRPLPSYFRDQLPVPSQRISKNGSHTTLQGHLMRHVFQGSRSAREDITHGFSTFEYFNHTGALRRVGWVRRRCVRRGWDLPRARVPVSLRVLNPDTGHPEAGRSRSSLREPQPMILIAAPQVPRCCQQALKERVDLLRSKDV